MNTGKKVLKMHSPEVCSAEEWTTRVDVAACYRLIHLYGLSDLSDGFVSARIPDNPSHFVIGGYGLFPELSSASVLHKRGLKQPIALEKLAGVDIDAFKFTRTILDRPEFNACLHAHTLSGITLSSLDCSLWPMSQWGIMFHGLLGYLPFSTTDVSSDESCEQIGKLLDEGNRVIIFRNHGFLIPGKSVAQTFFILHRLEQACAIQLAAMRTGAKITMPNELDARELRESYWTMTHVDNDGSREWPGLLQKLDGLDSKYRT